MLVLVAYDISVETLEGRRRLRQIAKACENRGQRVQNSLFECLVDPAQWERLRARLIEIMDSEKDSLRFYFLGKNWRKRIQHVGAKPSYDPQGPLIA